VFHFDDRDADFKARYVRVRLQDGVATEPGSTGRGVGIWSSPLLLDAVGELHVQLRMRGRDSGAVVRVQVSVDPYGPLG
jgi:hypothetical protein